MNEEGNGGGERSVQFNRVFCAYNEFMIKGSLVIIKSCIHTHQHSHTYINLSLTICVGFMTKVMLTGILSYCF